MEEKNGVAGIFILIAVMGLFLVFHNNKKVDTIKDEYGYSTKTTVTGKVDCNSPDPANPYSSGTGHYAGYNWYWNNGYCTEGNSNSFYEGCLEAQNQDEAYTYCLDN